MRVLIGRAYCVERERWLEAQVSLNDFFLKEHAERKIVEGITSGVCPVTGKSFSRSDIEWSEMEV